MTLHSIVKAAMVTSILFGSVCHADTSAEGMATGKRQHKPITVTKPIDMAAPALARGSSASAKDGSFQNARSAYRLCPDGTMISAGEKCPEKNTTK